MTTFRHRLRTLTVHKIPGTYRGNRLILRAAAHGIAGDSEEIA